MRRPAHLSYVQGTVRFGFNHKGEFIVEVMTEGGDVPPTVDKAEAPD